MKRKVLYFAVSVMVCSFFVLMSYRPRGARLSEDDGLRSITLKSKPLVEVEAEGFDAPEEFERYHREIRTRDGETGPAYPLNFKMIEVNKANAAKAMSLFKYNGLAWTERGPGNVGGRTRGLIIDPDDPSKNTWIAGSVSGGIWKTTNAGATWVNKTPSTPNLATVTLAMAPSNHSVCYAGTGEGFSNIDAVRGDGIWKSVDRGETWTQLPSTAGNSNFWYVNRVVVDPSNENIVLAATNTGIFRSTDGGSSWTAKYSGGGKIQQIIENPLNFNTLYATRNSNGVIKSVDRGLSWAIISDGIGPGARCELAVSPVDTARLFLAMETSPSVSDLYVSDDGGANWGKASVVSGSPPNWLNGQGWYDNAIAAHPYDRDICFVGGLDLYKIQITSSVTRSAGVLSISLNNTTGFLTFVNWGGPYAGGGVGSGKDFYKAIYGTTTAPVSLSDSDYVPVEIRFGPGMTQKAHRFGSNGNIVYPYLDYVSVPFQVWDVVNNRQLMVSFRDAYGSGVFTLHPITSGTQPQEYIFIHAVPYDASGPNANIAVLGGEGYKTIDAIWPALVSGLTWSPSLPPTSNLRINNGVVIGRFRNTTRMTNWVPNQSLPYVHADHHNISIIPVNQATQSFRIVHGSDGGIAASTNSGVSWTTPNLGYNTSQFYGVDKRPGISQYIGGTQDNGTFLSPTSPTASSTWAAVLGGDGFPGVWNYKDGNKIMVSNQYNGLARSTNGGSTFASATTDLVDVGTDTAPFISQIAKSNSDTDLLFVLGSSGIWRSDNFGENWTLFRVATADWGFGSGANAAISIANPQIVWAGVRMSNPPSSPTGKLHLSTDGGASFTPTVNYSTVTLGRLSGLATHPTQERTAYALFSFASRPKILRTTDLGQTWQDISGFGTGSVSTTGFPDVATYCLLVMPHNPNEIWVGTEIGLFVSTNNGTSWTYANDVIPAVAIWQLRAVDDEIVAATHGRGIWSVKIPALLTAPPPVVTLAPRLNKSGQKPDGSLAINLTLRSLYDSTQVSIKGTRVFTLAANASLKDTLVSFQILKADSLWMSAIAFKGGKPYPSGIRGLKVTLPQAPRAFYVDNFNTTSTNFTSSGFTLQTPSGFSSQAFHTPHPYSNSGRYTLNLNIPIIVQPANAFIRYDEIALVEPGDSGSVYGAAAFYDYVVVEATKDGANWIPVEDGYDARRDTAWSSAFESGISPTSKLIRPHQMNLLDRFSAGDIVSIRFRLWSDEYTTGWGWMIDNLEIQGNLTSVRDDKATIPSTFSLAQNYPNPFNPSTVIRFEIPVESRVTLTIYDILGRTVRSLVDGQLKPGIYTDTWNASGFASGIYFYRIDAQDMTSGSGRRFSETKRLVLLK